MTAATSSLGGPGKMFSGRAALLPVMILALIALFVVPIPVMLLDVFFVFNILVSLLVLMVALNAQKPLDFSSFPTVLLFATLLRLALNVASTRIVLVSGHEGPHAAGKVIEAFGAFLIGGNFIVGLFVFAILVIINLVVITKGAGRVSEVSARFTLDALPGKQMAIDADLAAGLMTPDEAKARRVEVSTEADFYGSMDGASKFVKGDAVAALLILALNIIGGFILGMAQHGLSFGDAASTYIILAIGDGLVAQVPALLLSIAAAVIVTRVNSAHDLTGQVTSQFAGASAWIPVAAILFILGLLPGMPHLLMLSFAGLAGYAAWRLSRKPKAAEAADDVSLPAEMQPAERPVEWADVVDNVQMNVDIGFALIDLVNERSGAPLVARITSIRRQLSQRLGFVIPHVRIRDSLELAPNAYRISLGSMVCGESEIYADRMLALDPGAVAQQVEGHATVDPAFGLPALWIENGTRDQAIASGYTVVDPGTVLATHLNQIILSRAHQIFGQEEADRLVESLGETAPKLASGLVPGALSLQSLTIVLQRLLEEGVSIRDFRRIAECLSAVAPRVGEPALLAEHVRRALGGVIVQQVAGVHEALNVVTFAAELEKLLSESVGESEGNPSAIEPKLAQELVAAFTQTARTLADNDTRFALVTTPHLRRTLFLLLRQQIPDLTVLSFDEIPDDKAVQVVSVIGGQAE